MFSRPPISLPWIFVPPHVVLSFSESIIILKLPFVYRFLVALTNSHKGLRVRIHEQHKPV